jgi:hypothetical protein
MRDAQSRARPSLLDCLVALAAVVGRTTGRRVRAGIAMK